MKIFLGMNNIASLMRDYKEGFTALGHDCFCVSKYEAAIVDGPVDMMVPRFVESMLRKKNDYSPQAQKEAYNNTMTLAKHKALEADVCFFMWETFHPHALDLAEFKKLGKRIIVRLCGSEVRDPHVDAQYVAHYDLQSTEYGLGADLGTLRHKLRYLRNVEQYADVIINGSSMSLRPFNWKEGCLFSQQGMVRRTAPQRKVPVILHAPSNKSTKGTDIWQAVFDMLRGAGVQFGLKLVENIPHADMLREYATADIVCGSLFYGGRAMWEALSAGCVHVGVGSKIRPAALVQDDLLQLKSLGLPPDDTHTAWKMSLCDNFAPIYGAPNVDVTQEDVAQILGELILDLPRRQALAAEGPLFMDRWFTPEKTCQDLLNALFEEDTLERQVQLHAPSVFRHHYIPPDNDPQRVKLFNEYSQLVSHCDWYKTFVPRGERAGLIF